MGSIILHTPGIESGISLDLNFKQVSRECGVGYSYVKYRLNGPPPSAPPRKKSAAPSPPFSLIPVEYMRKVNGEDESRQTFVVPFEALPLVRAHLQTVNECNPLTARKQYLRKLRRVRARYFAQCRDSDPSYQQLYTDSLCTEALAERLSAVLALSQMGEPEMRPQMLMTCLTDLETLICSLRELYFPDGYPAFKRNVPDFKTGEPFHSLYERLCSRRCFNEDGDLQLTRADCSADEENLAASLNTALSRVTHRRTTSKGSESRSSAKKLYSKWLAKQVRAEEKRSANRFSHAAIRLEDYLRDHASDSGQRIKKILFTQLYRFADQLQQDSIVAAQPYPLSFDTKSLPPKALFLQRATINSYVEITQTTLPYLSLDHALEGITRMAIYAKEDGPFLVSESIDLLLNGAAPILDAAISRLSTLLETANFEYPPNHPFYYMKADPLGFAAELSAFLSGYQQTCQSKQLYLNCQVCSLHKNCTYRLYAEHDYKQLQIYVSSLAEYLKYRDYRAQISIRVFLDGLAALKFLYRMMVGILARRAAEAEVETLLKKWDGHIQADSLLQSVLKSLNYTDSILKLVQSTQNKGTQN